MNLLAHHCTKLYVDGANPESYIGHVDLVRAGEFSTDIGSSGLQNLLDFPVVFKSQSDDLAQESSRNYRRS